MATLRWTTGDRCPVNVPIRAASFTEINKAKNEMVPTQICL